MSHHIKHLNANGIMNQLSMAQNKIQLSIIVLFYHGERWIEGCIQSLQDQSLARSTYEIILVDNGGSTPSVKKYEGEPDTKVLHFSKNYGFAGGNNKALSHAAGEFILLMNQDVVVHFNCLEELMIAAEHNPHAGVISTNMVMISSSTYINRHASTDKTVGIYKLTPFGYAAYSVQETDSEMVPVEFISGNGMCFRRSVLGNVGNYLFDAELKSYAEDLDLSIRLKKTKWGMYVRPTAVIYHYRDAAFSGHPFVLFRKFVHISTNRMLVYYKNFSLGKFLAKMPLILVGVPLKVARPDGASKFHLLNFWVAFIFIPIILVNFCLKIIQFSKPS